MVSANKEKNQGGKKTMKVRELEVVERPGMASQSGDIPGNSQRKQEAEPRLVEGGPRQRAANAEPLR